MKPILQLRSYITGIIPLLLAGSALISPAQAQTSLYNPIAMPSDNVVDDTLSESDIPTGTGGFSRDYLVTFEEDDYAVIDLASEEFDTVVTLIAPDGSTFGENDDGPDGNTNSMLFVRITEGGTYTVRVSPYAGQGLGTFNLKVTRLQPVE
ncbi:MAG: PPC domain-containing protein [Cyanobacteria bacterium P01_A01_bin.135]